MEEKDCVHGCQTEETDSHLFFHCHVAKAIWFATPWSIRWDSFEDLVVEAKLKILINLIGVLPVLLADKENFFMLAIIIMDHLWRARHQKRFEGRTLPLEEIINWI